MRHRFIIATSCLALTSGALGQTQPAPTSQPDDVIHVHGRVLEPGGKPAAGATITVPGTWHWERPLRAEIVARTTADAEGRFDVAFKKADVSIFSHGGGDPGGDDWKTAKIVASAKGVGMDFAEWNTPDEHGDLVLKLVPDDHPIRGRIVDEAGKPIEGVKIVVDLLYKKLESLEKEMMTPGSYQKRSLTMPTLSTGNDKPTLTDTDGRFELAGFGNDRSVSLRTIGPTIAYKRFGVQMKDAEKRIIRTPQPAGFDTETITYGATFEHTAAPGQSVQGTITDVDTGKPIAGVLVESLYFADRSIEVDPQRLLTCITDADGHYRLDGFPIGKTDQLIVVPDGDEPYFMHQETLGTPPAGEAETIDIQLHRGVFITGKVTDKTTHAPVPARMQYTTYLDNPHTASIPEFRHDDRNYDLDGFQSRYETKPDGTYRIVAVPGKAIVGAWVRLEGYRTGVGFDDVPALDDRNGPSPLFDHTMYRTGTNIVVETDVPVGVKQVACDLEADPGATVHVAIVDPDGKPAARMLQARGQEGEDYGGPYFHEINGPTFDARGFAPGEARTIFIIDDDRKLGRAVRTNADEGAVEIELKALGEVSGRLLDTKGQPLADINVEITDTNDDGRTARSVRTDKDGRFATSVPVGVTYGLTVSDGVYVGRQIVDALNPEPGANGDLGEFRITPLIR